MNKKTIFKICISVVIALVVVVGAFWGMTTVRYFFHRPFFVRGESMMPTLEPDTLHHCNTTATPKVGDIILFYRTEDGAEASRQGFFDANAYLRSMPIWGMRIADEPDGYDILVKRVVAAEGDVIEMRAETVDDVNFIYLYRNGEKVREDVVMLNMDALNDATKAYAQSLYDRYGRESSHGARPMAAYTVPEGCYYVLGDNRDSSSDSRRFGPVPKANVLGVVTK